MSASRDKMINALRQIVVPTLRDMQFKGTFPHFKRPRESQMDLLAFQFSRWGGSFVIEVAWCDPKGWLKRTGEIVEPDEVRVNHINPKQRLRLGSNPPKQADYWFRFEPESDGIYADVALEALTLVRSQGEDFWQHHKPAMVTDPNWPRE
jgi:hypothetical protein